MNTLPRAITAQVLGDPSHFHILRRHWGALIRSPRRHELSAAHHLLYLALIGKDWRRGFSPVASRRKLENGAFHGWMLFRALGTLHSSVREDALLAPFDGLVTPLMLQSIRQMIPCQQPYKYKPDQFSPGVFPFEAYTSPSLPEPSEPDTGEPDA